ncbi:MAG: hypothetical protein WCP16_21960 [Pseudanabaena sp. ELA645]|jgi:hypothetical protein
MNIWSAMANLKSLKSNNNGHPDEKTETPISQASLDEERLERLGKEIINLVDMVNVSGTNIDEIVFSKNQDELISNYFFWFNTLFSFSKQHHRFAEHEITTLKKLALLLMVDNENNLYLWLSQRQIFRFLKTWIEPSVKLPYAPSGFGCSLGDTRTHVFGIIDPCLNGIDQRKARAKKVHQFIRSAGRDSFAQNSGRSGRTVLVFDLVEESFELFEGMGKIWVEHLKSSIEMSKEYYNDIYHDICMRPEFW